MSLALSSARLSRRRRRFSTPTVESLETRQLLTGTVAPASAFDLHAQYLRLIQLNGGATPHHTIPHATAVHAAASHPTATHRTPTHGVTAAVTARHRTFGKPALPSARQLTDIVTYSRPSSISPNAGGRGTSTGALAVDTPVIGAHTPAQIRTAYGVTPLGLANQGQGTTIAIVELSDDPNITRDANAFSAQYNLPQFNGPAGSPTLTVYQDTTFAPVTSAAGTGVARETSLDVEWAHAMAPKANILLVEVPFFGTTYADIFGDLLHGVQYAASQPGVVAVSLSYGTDERNIGTDALAAQDAAYLATGPAANVAVTISSGDGSSPLYPATSPNVIAVGGTSLLLGSVRGKYSLESAWGGLAGLGAGGGGPSLFYDAPSYQTSNGVTYPSRAVPDVALIADPVTGVSFYDSLDVTASDPSPWLAAGGTSLAAPVFAGMIALAQQNRLAAGLPLLNSNQINNEIYAVYNSPSYSTYFHDITLGSNTNVDGKTGQITVDGYAATTGYDLATGVGSPIGNTFVPLLSSL